MGHLYIQPIPLNDLHIPQPGHHARIIKRYKPVYMRSEVRTAELSKQKSLRRLDSPYIFAVNKG
jgi:hypothetical protein